MFWHDFQIILTFFQLTFTKNIVKTILHWGNVPQHPSWRPKESDSQQLQKATHLKALALIMLDLLHKERTCLIIVSTFTLYVVLDYPLQLVILLTVESLFKKKNSSNVKTVTTHYVIYALISTKLKFDLFTWMSKVTGTKI